MRTSTVRPLRRYRSVPADSFTRATASSPRFPGFLVLVHPLVGETDERFLGRRVRGIGGDAEGAPDAGVDPFLLQEGVPLDQPPELLGEEDGRAGVGLG